MCDAERSVVYFACGKVYLHGDHPSTSLRASLGSTSLVTCGSAGGCNGTPYQGGVSRQWYHPYGSVRVSEGTLPTDVGFTGQRANYYDNLLTYKQAPTPEAATPHLSEQFNELFSTVTGYAALDDRIAKTRAKKDALLMALQHPELPLHNNPAELAARRRGRKRNVSFGPRTEAGKKAWDTFQSLAETTKKLGVSFYQYIFDRVFKANRVLPLADVIAERAKSLRLSASWDAP